jgi:SAM-dependent methyltransferase
MNDPHLGGCVIDNNRNGDGGTWASQLWDKLIEMIKPKSVLDVGCGAGYSLKYFIKEKGLIGVGIEGYEDAIKRSPISTNIIKHDYTKGSLELDQNFDFAWCCEFVEHVEEQYVDNFMKNFQKCKHVGMTHGLPGQPGFHHVNCQPPQYWIDMFKKYGFEYLDNDTLLLRRTLLKDQNGSFASDNWTENGSHVRNSFMLFRKKNSND